MLSHVLRHVEGSIFDVYNRNVWGNLLPCHIAPSPGKTQFVLLVVCKLGAILNGKV